jgi:outer membrane protein TolC
MVATIEESMMVFGRITRLSALLATVALTGCASSTADRGFERVAALTEPHTKAKIAWLKSSKERDAIRSAVDELLQKPLGVDEAVRLGLLNNRGLQASYAELGLAASDLAQASRLPNPGFAFKRLSRNDDLDIERQFSLNLLGVLALPLARGIEERRFEQAQLKAANDVVAYVADVRRAWYRAVATQQAATYIEQVKDAAEIRVEFARRLRAAGNWSTLDYMRQQIFYAEIVGRIANARRMASRERERLARLLGLFGADLAFKLPERLPDAPDQPEDVGDIEAKAIAERFDIQMGKAEIAGLARSLGLTKTTRFLNVLETSYFRNSATGQPRQTGYEISLEIPLFDWGDAKVARAEYVYMQAADRLAELAIKARSEVREAYLDYRTAHDLALHFQKEVLPLRKQISEETVLRFNGMLIGVFELIADARDQISSVVSAIEAQREFWLAETTLRFVAIADTGDGGEPPSLGGLAGAE